MIEPNVPDNIQVILFDLGGVLVEFIGVQKLRELSGGKLEEEELWEKWLISPAVRAFETGKINAPEFSRRIVRELALPISAEGFAEEFPMWLTRMYPGSYDLLDELSGRHILACFSNTNELHWPKMKEQFGLHECFDHTFISCDIGKLKPDLEAFAHIIEELDILPEAILFLDDNRINVEGARRSGMIAHRVRGPVEAREVLTSLNLL